MAQYLATNRTYSDFLKAFKVEEEKGFFPYEWSMKSFTMP